MTAVVVDTNVPVVANGASPQADARCVVRCAEAVLSIVRGESQLVLDDGDAIFREYLDNLHLAGQPGIGDRFLKWVFDHRFQPNRCLLIRVSEACQPGTRRFREFPSDPDLEGFDPSDQKFVAVAIASACDPPVLNAVDSDWWEYERILARHGVRVVFVCHGQVTDWQQQRIQR